MSTEIVRTQPNTINPFLEYAEEIAPRTIVGTLLKFSKGEWLAGEDARVVPIGAQFVAHVGELIAGWVRWYDGRPIEHRMVRIADGTRRLPRTELGDTDKNLWELDANGKQRDPWQYTNYLPLLSKGGELYTFATGSSGGKGVIAGLCRQYAQDVSRHPDRLPVIALDVDSYQHKQKEFGRIKVPKFTPAGYAAKALFDEALAKIGLAVSDVPPTATSTVAVDDYVDDEIPF